MSIDGDCCTPAETTGILKESQREVDLLQSQVGVKGHVVPSHLTSTCMLLLELIAGLI